jgi:DNA-binding NtrC family response regulator
MRAVRAMVDRVARTNASVLITGETGTGKTLVAREIHERSDRRAERFEVVNCGALTPTLIESELFGHERAAFSGADRRHAGVFEVAGRGTIFLDEIGDLPLDLQPKLLRVLEARRYRPVGAERENVTDARIIAATNVDLGARAAELRFRDDLLYRLNVIEIQMPILSERGLNDFAELVSALNQRGALQLQFTKQAIAWLYECAWPGNVRQLANVIERLQVMSDSRSIDWMDLERLTASSDPVQPRLSSAERLSEDPKCALRQLKELELGVYEQVMRRCGTESAAARLLGMPRTTLQRRIGALRARRGDDASTSEPRLRKHG